MFSPYIPDLQAQTKTLTDEEFQSLISKEDIPIGDLVGINLTKEQFKILSDKMEADRAKERAREAAEAKARKQLLKEIAEKQEVEKRRIRRAYVTNHPKRPKKILDAISDGKNLVIGMTPEEVRLILTVDPDRTDRFSDVRLGISEDWTYKSYDDDSGELVVYVVHFRHGEVTGTSTSKIKR